MKLVLLVVVWNVVCLSSAMPEAWAQWVDDGTVVCADSSAQFWPVLVADGTGGAIITWGDLRDGYDDIYAQRVDALGVVQWTTDGVVLCTATDSQIWPAIASDGAGGAIVSWDDSRDGDADVYVQRVDGSGVAQWTVNGVALCTSSGDQQLTATISDGAGGAIVAWQDSRSGADDIYVQRVNASGVVQWTAGGVALCTAARRQLDPKIVSDGAGGAIITWWDERSGTDSWDIYAQRVNASGVIQWTAGGVALCTDSADGQTQPRIASDGSGGAIVTWRDDRAGNSDVYAQRVNASGAVQWTTDGVPLCTDSGHQFHPEIVADDAGGAIVTWSDARPGGGDYSIYVQRVSASGVVQWTADGVALCTSTIWQANPKILSDGLSGAIVTWEDERGANMDIYAQRVDASGVVQWTANGIALCMATNNQTSPQLTSDGAGGAIVTWNDVRSGSLNYDVYGQRILPNGYLAIKPSVTVTAPNGGEIWNVGDTEDIMWTATDSDGVDSVSIYYSIDGGGDYTLIASGEANDGVYPWTIPDLPTNSALIKVVAYDPAINEGEDVSDAVFTIADTTSPVVTVTSPNGGETQVIGQPWNIYWTATDNVGVDSVSIYYSVNAGGEYILLASGEANDGVYWMMTPDTPTTQGLVKVVAYDPSLNEGEDVSDAVFTIADVTPPVVTVTSPNGFETWYAGDVENITWTATDSDGVDSVSIFYSINDGRDYVQIASGEANNGFYPWVIPYTPSDSALVKVVAYDSNLNTGEDTSDDLFAIVVPDTIAPAVTVLAPNGGEIWYVCDTEEITWTATDASGVDSVCVYYSVNGGDDYTLLASGEANDGAFPWSVPDTLTDNALVSVVAFDSSLNAGTDTSDAVFEVAISHIGDWMADGDQEYASFGYSVASAGDVNGDGYEDVIIGAYGYDDALGNEGRAIVYHGSSSGLSATPDWAIVGGQASAWLGNCVSSAGDVNGDGYDDVIVAAYKYDNGETDEGRVFVYHGGPSGLSATADWTAESDQGWAYFGYSVSGAGDVNGDGYDDVIVGAHSYDNIESGEGRAFVYHGGATGLSPTAAWTAESDQAWAYFGCSVSGAGDVDGDGYGDVVVGARQYDNGESDEGRAYVYHGSATGLSATASWTAESNQANADFGYSLSGAGDVNGDGYGDVVVGARQYDNGESNEGRAYVYHGSSSGLSGTAAWTAEGDQIGASLGNCVSNAGDLNDDGYGDIIIGAPYYDNGEADEGGAFAYYGSPSGLSTAPDWSAEGDEVEFWFGRSVAGAGDVNGDGFDDVLVGVTTYVHCLPGEGAAFLFYGDGPALPTGPDWAVVGGQASAEFGYSSSSAGDVNGDGYDDVIIGAYLYDNGETDEGQALVYYGGPFGPAIASDWTAESDQAGAWFGRSVSSAGDVNGDGYDDVIVGAPTYDRGETNEGVAFVYCGSDTGLSTTPDWIADCNQAGAYFGAAVSSAGDVNDDGYDDVIVGAYAYDGGETDEGRAFVYHGSASGLSNTAVWAAQINQSDAEFGRSVSSAGDVNGDGYDDVIVGAFAYESGEANEGAAFVYHGSASGLSGTADWTAQSDQADAFFGCSVSGAGDVNGDGYGDVVVGAYLYDNGETNEGCAFGYEGSASGLSTMADWIGESDQVGSRFGWSVSGAGDLNGDTYGDVIVGAYEYTNGESDEGRVFVYRGAPTGLSGVADWTAESDQAGAYFGRSVAGAGDVNGDGAPDIIVGANMYESVVAAVAARSTSGVAAPLRSSASSLVDEGGAFVYLSTRGTVDVPDDPGRDTTDILYQNYPNPFRSSGGTKIAYSVVRAGRVEIRIFDVAGRLINSIKRLAKPGNNTVFWNARSGDGRPLAGGVYFYEIRTEGFRAHRKMILLK
jgi:hypothetical protein